MTYAVVFGTRFLPCFNEFDKLFYKNKKKKTIPESIFDILTPISLAHWIMGDGAKLNNGLVLCTDSFTIEEVITLMIVLNI